MFVDTQAHLRSSFGMHCRALALLFAALSTLCVRSMIEREVASIAPAERLATNLIGQIELQPKDGELYAQLARVYAIWSAREAFANPSLIYAKPNDRRGAEQLILKGFREESQYQATNVPPPLKLRAMQDCRKHLSEAIKCYQKAIELGRTNVFVYLGLGWVQQQAGNTNAARDDYRIALKLSQTYKPTVEYLDDLNVTREAAEYLMGVLDFRKDYSEWAAARGVLESTYSRRESLKITPLLVPLTTNPISLRDLINWNARVLFNLDGSGPQPWQWITTNAAWLVYQSKPSERITSGIQLFGNVTFWIFWRNGYDTLAALDNDGNGYLEGAELDHLALWHDRNPNGISESDEIEPLSSYGIVRHSTHARPLGHATWLSADGVLFRDGTVRPTYDVTLQTQRE